MKASQTQFFPAFVIFITGLLVSGNATAQTREHNIIDEVSASTQFNTFLSALDAADLTNVLRGNQHYTVFIPTDAAFEKLPKSTFIMLLEPRNKARLIELLTHHMVDGRLGAVSALEAGSTKPLSNEVLAFDVKDNALRIDGAEVLASDLEVSNGVIHVIDEVLLPASFERQLSIVPQPTGTPLE
jgi:uncharacterized surface protein with fasciclin (FAS1) repeats